MYGRRYKGRSLRFEASGGLLHGAMVMRDKETGSYWSIITGDAIAGDFAGTPLGLWPLAEKARWKDWVARHPDTIALSVNGQEHVDANPHESYYTSAAGFRGIAASDRRLVTKSPVYSFRLGEQEYAVPFSAFEDGAIFRAGGREMFLYRPRGAEVFRSSLAFVGAEGAFAYQERGWFHEPSGTFFNPDKGCFVSATGSEAAVERLEGFDTYWYMWSLTHPGAHVLAPASNH